MLIICVGTCILRVLWVFGAGAVPSGTVHDADELSVKLEYHFAAFLVYYYRFSAMRKLNKLIEE